ARRGCAGKRVARARQGDPYLTRMEGMKTLQIDFVSDVACPWCAIGLSSLDRAIERLQGEVGADIRFQPFELNPDMGPEGQDLTEHLAQKYGSTPEQQAANREGI